MMFEFQTTSSGALSVLQGDSTLKNSSVKLSGKSLSVASEFESLYDCVRAAEAFLPIVEAQNAPSLEVNLSSFREPKKALGQLFRALAGSTYEYTRYKAPTDRVLKKVVFLGEESLRSDFEFEKQLNKAVDYAKDLVNGPANFVNPSFLAETAKGFEQLSKKVKVEVFSYDWLKELGFGAFCGVAQGSANKGCMVLIRYQGKNDADPYHALVGKGITFDSGGLSLKPAASMETMNSDMAGAASVLSALRYAIEADLPVNLLGALACAENMPDGTAQRPSDIVKTYSGKTVEILNTDAEGRLVLCDTLTYVARNFQVSSMVDIATLTGAQVVALGTINSALYANDEPLAQKLLNAAYAAEDGAHRMPLGTEYTRMLRSEVADLANISAPRGEGGSITAAAFLEQFVEKAPWAHIDIAGPARSKKGATGRPVPLLIHYIQTLLRG